MTIDTKRLATDYEYWIAQAPEGATHYNTEAACPWLKCSPAAYFIDHYNGWMTYLREDAALEHIENAIPRPKPQEAEWVDGLPPVGCECEGDADTRPGGYESCLVVYHNPLPKKFEHSSLALFTNKHDGRYTEAEWCSDFRPGQMDRDELADLIHRGIEVEMIDDNFNIGVGDAVDAIIAAGWSKS